MDCNLCYSHTSDMRAIHSAVAGLPGDMPLKKMNFPSPRSYQGTKAPQLWVGPHEFSVTCCIVS